MKWSEDEGPTATTKDSKNTRIQNKVWLLWMAEAVLDPVVAFFSVGFSVTKKLLSTWLSQHAGKKPRRPLYRSRVHIHTSSHRKWSATGIQCSINATGTLF